MNTDIPTPSLDTWLTSQLLTVDELNANIRDSQKFLAYSPLTIVTRAATQAIATSTQNVKITWDTEVVDIDGMFSAPSTNLTVQRPGIYSIQFQPHFAFNATGMRSGHIAVNDGWVASSNNQTANPVDTALNCSAILALKTGDVITGMLYQDSGVSLNTGGLSNWGAPRMAVRLISAATVDSSGSTVEPGDSTPPSGTPTQQSKTYYATWSRTYDGSLATTWDDSAHCYQGQYNPQPARGLTRSLIGFDYNTIKSDLAGATNLSAKVTFKVLHWYSSAGGTAYITNHNYTSKPSTWSSAHVWQQTTKNVLIGQTYTVSLPVAVANGFQNGNTTGLGFGPPPSTSNNYYGYMAGATESGKPSITFTYWK